MTTQSLDEVLAGAAASEQEQDTATETLETDQIEQDADQDHGEQGEGDGHDAHGALHAERQRVKRKYTDTVADFERKLTEANGSFEKKLTESLQQNDQKWEQRFNQFAQSLRPKEAPQEPVVPDYLDDADGFVKHVASSAVDPVKRQFDQLREHYSQREAVREHGAEKVQAAFQALHNAALSGDPEAQATAERVKTASIDPYGEIVAWHQRVSVIQEVGRDPQAYRQRMLDEALKDPAFLAKAAAALGGKQPGATTPGKSASIPSLNSVTAAAGEDDEEENVVEVFNSALRSGVRR